MKKSEQSSSETRNTTSPHRLRPSWWSALRGEIARRGWRSIGKELIPQWSTALCGMALVALVVLFPEEGWQWLDRGGVPQRAPIVSAPTSSTTVPPSPSSPVVSSTVPSSSGVVETTVSSSPIAPETTGGAGGATTAPGSSVEPTHEPHRDEGQVDRPENTVVPPVETSPETVEPAPSTPLRIVN